MEDNGGERTEEEGEIERGMSLNMYTSGDPLKWNLFIKPVYLFLHV